VRRVHILRSPGLSCRHGKCVGNCRHELTTELAVREHTYWGRYLAEVFLSKSFIFGHSCLGSYLELTVGCGLYNYTAMLLGRSLCELPRPG